MYVAILDKSLPFIKAFCIINKGDSQPPHHPFFYSFSMVFITFTDRTFLHFFDVIISKYLWSVFNVQGLLTNFCFHLTYKRRSFEMIKNYSFTRKVSCLQKFLILCNPVTGLRDAGTLSQALLYI